MSRHRPIRLEYVNLHQSVNDPRDRYTMPMSTLIASDAWLLETTWDGSVIGDVQVFRNKNVTPNGDRTDLLNEKGNVVLDADGKRVPAPHEWAWWGGVPRAMIRTYRFSGENLPEPQTIAPPLPFPDAQRKEEPRQAGQARSGAGGVQAENA